MACASSNLSIVFSNIYDGLGKMTVTIMNDLSEDILFEKTEAYSMLTDFSNYAIGDGNTFIVSGNYFKEKINQQIGVSIDK